MKEKRLVVIVCGYGPDSSPSLERCYLESVRLFLTIREDDIDLVVLSGGQTKNDHPAGATKMSSFFMGHHSWASKLAFMLENKSVTSMDSLRFSADILANRVLDCRDGRISPETHSIAIYCEVQQMARNRYTAARRFPGYEVDIFGSPACWLEPAWKHRLISWYQKAATHFRPLEVIWRWKRLRSVARA